MTTHKLHASMLAALLPALLNPIPAAMAQEKQMGLEEVVVTAQRREEGLQDVPISVQAFSKESLDNLTAQDIGDLGYFSPNVEITRASNQPRYTIRGIGTDDFGVGADPAVGVYLDGVYIGRSGGSKTAFNDISRVEILNGPQGTLFGRNAAAGAIQYVTNKPFDGDEAYVKTTVGNYERLQNEGLYNTALTDNLFWRTSALHNQRDGYIDNNFLDKEVGEEDNWSIVSSLLWQPSERMDVLFRIEYDEYDNDSRPSSSAVFGSREGKSFDDNESSRKLPEERELWGTSIHLSYDLEFATFTSISSYREYESSNPEDKDGGNNIRYLFNDLNEEDNEQWSQEFRFEGEYGDRFTWLTGFSYNYESAEQTSGIDLSSEAVEKLIAEVEIGVPFESLPPGLAYELAWGALGVDPSEREFDTGLEALAFGTYSERINVTGDYEAWAVFADGTYSITDTLDLTLGIRYTEDEKEFSRNITLNEYGFGFAWPEPTTRNENGRYDPNGTPGRIRQTESWDDTTGRAVLDWRVTDDVLLYVSYSEGYKAGGFSSATPTNDDAPFDPEEISTWEVGGKSSWFDNTLRFNAAYFDYDYDNLQEQNFVDAACLGGNFGANVFETQDIEGDGFELNLTWLALPGLELFANAGVVDAEVTERERCREIDGEAVTFDESGQDYADDFSYALGASYTYDLPNAGQINASIAWGWEEGEKNRQDCTYVQDLGDGTSAIYGLDVVDGELIISDPSATGNLTEPPFSSCPDLDDREQLNSRISYTSPEEKWIVGAWITNATDWEEDADPGGLGGDLASDCCTDGSPSWDRRERPRMYGMDVQYNFN